MAISWTALPLNISPSVYFKHFVGLLKLVDDGGRDPCHSRLKNVMRASDISYVTVEVFFQFSVYRIFNSHPFTVESHSLFRL